MHVDDALHVMDELYSVLNVPACVSDTELRDRYKALSIQFHPDKHHDPRTKEAASQHFLDIQRAYSVLSDPFLRVVYDVLGEQGLHQPWPPELRTKSPEQVRAYLTGSRRTAARMRTELAVAPRGTFTANIDAKTLFLDVPPGSGITFSDRLRGVRISKYGISHRIQPEISENTTLGLSAGIDVVRASVPAPNNPSRRTIVPIAQGGALAGTLRHQISPRLAVEASITPFPFPLLTTTTSYAPSPPSSITVSTAHVLSSPVSVLRGLVPFPPLVTATYSRRLWRNSPATGTLTYTTFEHLSPAAFLNAGAGGGLGGRLTLGVDNARSFDFTGGAPFVYNPLDDDSDEEEDEETSGKPGGDDDDSKERGGKRNNNGRGNGSGRAQGPGSTSGFARGTARYSSSLSLVGPLGTLKTEWALHFPELGLRVGAGVEGGTAFVPLQSESEDGGVTARVGLALTGGVRVDGGWEDARGRGGVGMGVGCGQGGVSLSVNFTLWKQRLRIPILMSGEPDGGLALLAGAVPVAVLATAYIVYLRPRRIEERARYFKAARQALEDEQHETRRSLEDTARALADAAARSTRAERACDGLIIIEASYGPAFFTSPSPISSSPSSSPTPSSPLTALLLSLSRLSIFGPSNTTAAHAESAALRALCVDVTPAVQSLVSHSQMCIPAGRLGRSRTRAALPGFVDPAPGLRKVLRVRYTFRGRMHYAEVADGGGVVLPLREHLVE
ncbi:hypothetical protein CONPUDRAFT_168228 [Coniophora puteana RWD-64-598 SS2]|uniref:J domain-containing protein n=1 Tax=Coniophora puteana (strain RWD-64-598) TaxID=741705 RepID=A0A5M3MDB7_CONPW|nr:uncharacterized protein CONPUDRAFT_168228 [Coniophora puteana RWD-64-598 SS2]EIW77239.1 hypothetical protein CONPUDRAFT_168228 [Coniophora puteana RWD-64-598 SS2]